MKKYIRILEVPVLLLIIALFCLEIGNTAVAVFLMVISIARLLINKITDGYGNS
tara:strand:+ start:289 stop:450 length:162 start_codon:yes stop_codon:yes gene_type:complete